MLDQNEGEENETEGSVEFHGIEDFLERFDT